MLAFGLHLSLTFREENYEGKRFMSAMISILQSKVRNEML